MGTGGSPEPHRLATLAYIAVNKRPWCLESGGTEVQTLRMSSDLHTHTVACTHLDTYAYK